MPLGLRPGLPVRHYARQLHTSTVRCGFFRDLLGLDSYSDPSRPSEKNRFFMMDESPVEEIRRRAMFIKTNGRYPPGSDLPIQFTDPQSGVPTHHDEAQWKNDKEYWSSRRWEILKKANMYEEDLRSGRDFPELDFPGPTTDDQVANLLNWDTFFYTRDFASMDSEFQLAIATKMLTYPMTIAAILDEYSPFSLQPKGPMTLEGLKSVAALRYTMLPEERKPAWNDRPMRFFILGARMESQLPWHAWLQMCFLFPRANIQLVFIGPEAYYDRRKQRYLSLDGPLTERVTSNLSMTFYTDYFHKMNDAGDFYPYDPYLDAFFLFHPGLGAPEAMDQWAKTVPGLLESKCPVYVTGFHERDSMQDWEWLHRNFGNELDDLIVPTMNPFRSTKWEFNDLNPHEVYQLNQRLFAFRGKRYHVQ